MKTIKIILFAIIGVVLLIALAGHYKFNVLQDDIYVELDDGRVVKYNDLSEEEKTAMNSIVYRDEVVTYTGDVLFSAQFSENGKQVKVSLSGVQHELSQVKSASGAKYENEDGSVMFWEKGDEATLELNGETVTGTVAPAELPPLLANGWYWKETRYNNDEIVVAASPADFLLTFMEDGRVSVATDCNNGSGSYQTEGNMVTFGPMATTKMACPGETQETEYLSMLNEIQSYFVDEETNLILQLKYDSGVMIFMPAR